MTCQSGRARPSASCMTTRAKGLEGQSRTGRRVGHIKGQLSSPRTRFGLSGGFREGLRRTSCWDIDLDQWRQLGVQTLLGTRKNRRAVGSLAAQGLVGWGLVGEDLRHPRWQGSAKFAG